MSQDAWIFDLDLVVVWLGIFSCSFRTGPLTFRVNMLDYSIYLVICYVSVSVKTVAWFPADSATTPK